MVPKLNSVSHSVVAVPGARPVGDTGHTDSLPSEDRMRRRPALGAAVEGTGGALPNTGAGGGKADAGVGGALMDP